MNRSNVGIAGSYVMRVFTNAKKISEDYKENCFLSTSPNPQVLE